MIRRSIYKSPGQLRLMVEPGVITADALDRVAELVQPGVTTAELDAAAEELIVSRGAKSNFKMVRGYHHTTCISVNDEVVHGIPGDRVLVPGDIVSVDCGAELAGWNADSARTFIVPGEADTELVARREELSRVTEGALWAGIAAMSKARFVGDIGTAIEEYIEAQGEWGILREYVGHGIGRKMHEPPTVFNYRTPDAGPAIRPGIVLAIEPMVTAGSEITRVLDDEWTVSTVDGSDGSHWEHSIAVHDEGIWVMTSRDGGAEALAPFGVVPTPLS